jgi:hypothetical protein
VAQQMSMIMLMMESALMVMLIDFYSINKDKKFCHPGKSLAV